MVTGVERERDADHRVEGPLGGADNGALSVGAGETAHGTAREEKQNRLIVISYEGDTDPMDPQNRSFIRGFTRTTLTSWLGSVALWSSTIAPPALEETSKVFHTIFQIQSFPTGMYSCLQMSHEETLTQLALAFFLILLGLGGILSGTITEVFGRNPVYIVSLTLLILMDTSVALERRIICRGLAGLFASGPLVCSAAALVDLWSLVERVYIFPYLHIPLLRHDPRACCYRRPGTRVRDRHGYCS